MSAKVNVIVPVYHFAYKDLERFQKCFAHISSQTVKCHITVVNNASPYYEQSGKIGDLATLADTFISLPTNEGYGGGINAAMRLKIWPYSLFLNDDCFMAKDCVERLLAVSRGGVVACASTAKDGIPEPVQDVQYGKFDGSCWLVKDTIWDQVGEFDRRFGEGTFEDRDVWTRCECAGIKYARVMDACAQHLVQQTFDQLPNSKELYERNKDLYAQKWGRVD